MNTQPLTLDIFGTIEKLALDVAKVIVAQALIFAVLISAPVLVELLPLTLIYKNPNGNFAWLEQTIFYVAPWSCAVYMVIICHLHSVRFWQKAGRVNEWREAHPHKLLKSFGFLALGLVGSYAAELVYIFVMQSAPDVTAWFIFFPVASFAPVWITLIKRINYTENLTEPEEVVEDFSNDRDIQALAARQAAGRASRA